MVAGQVLMLVGTHSFKYVHQCAAYLGLVPVQKESGSSIKGCSQLAKNGNGTIQAQPSPPLVITLTLKLNINV